MKQKKHHLKHIKSYATLDLKKADLSKDMKKQSHTGKISTKPINKKQLSSDKSLSPKPKVGRYNAPNSKKKLSSEEFLSTSKLTHLKEMSHIKYFKSLNEEFYPPNWEDDNTINVGDITRCKAKIASLKVKLDDFDRFLDHDTETSGYDYSWVKSAIRQIGALEYYMYNLKRSLVRGQEPKWTR